MSHKRFILSLLFSLSILFPLKAEPVDTSMVRRMFNAVSDTALAAHIAALGEAGGYFNRISFTPGNTVAVNYISEKMRSLSGVSVVNDTFYVPGYPPPYGSMPLVNILGTIRGSSAPEKFVVIGAHLDCSASRMDAGLWLNNWKTIRTLGADDNASGVAAVLECVRILTDTIFHYKPDYSIVFAAWGNEEGIPEAGGSPGSAHFANDALASGRQILGMINVDMIGYNPQKIYADIFSNPESQWIGQRSLAVNAKYGLGITTNQMPFVNAGYSDHVSFWTDGYPAIMIIEHAFPWTSDDNYTASPYYHRSSDTLGTLNPALLNALTKLSLGTLISLAETAPTSATVQFLSQSDFVLEQNYPNPFNPATQFRFSLLHPAHIRLTVHDVLGRIVARPVDRTMDAGEHQIGWNASEFPAGVYFYTLTDGRNTATKKLLIEK